MKEEHQAVTPEKKPADSEDNMTVCYGCISVLEDPEAKVCPKCGSKHIGAFDPVKFIEALQKEYLSEQQIEALKKKYLSEQQMMTAPTTRNGSGQVDGVFAGILILIVLFGLAVMGYFIVLSTYPSLKNTQKTQNTQNTQNTREYQELLDLRQAAKNGDVYAQRTLGTIYGSWDGAERYGVKSSDKESDYWYFKAAAQGDKYSQKELGYYKWDKK